MGTLFIDTVPAEPKSPSRKKAPAKSRAAADEKHRK
jgi:hypothetical protein